MTKMLARQVRAMLLAGAVATLAAVWGPSVDPRLDALVGAGGWTTFVGCVGCSAGLTTGAFAGGLVWVAWAAWTPLGSSAVAGCAAVCIAAVL